jgi:hypothetical protein
MKMILVLVVGVLLAGCVKNGPANPNYRRDRPDRMDRPIHESPSRR